MKIRDVDLAIEAGNYRFRVNFFYTSDGLSAVLRKIETEIPTMQQLKLPFICKRWLKNLTVDFSNQVQTGYR